MPRWPMNNESRALNLLGLAMRAGQVISGDDMAEREIRAGRAAIVLLDEGASARTRDKYEGLCQRKGITLFLLSEDSLGRSIGKDGRMVATLKKGPLARQMETLLTAAMP